MLQIILLEDSVVEYEDLLVALYEPLDVSSTMTSDHVDTIKTR